MNSNTRAMIMRNSVCGGQWDLLRPRGLSTDAANPTVSVVLDHPDVLIASLFEQGAMFTGTEQRHACSIHIFFGQRGYRRISPFIDFRDDDEHSTRL